MKKILAAVSAILFCFAFSSCNSESGDVNAAEEIIIDDIETEAESFAADTTVTTTAAEMAIMRALFNYLSLKKNGRIRYQMNS